MGAKEFEGKDAQRMDLEERSDFHHQFFEAAAAINSEKELDALVSEYLTANKKAGFVALGTGREGPERIGISSVAANQAADAVTAIKELITNAVDSNIEQMAREKGISLEGMGSPQEAWEAVLGPDGAKGVEPDRVLMALTKNVEGKCCVTVVDRGAGQPPEAFIDTFLSLALGEKNKAAKKTSLGCFGQGSSATHRHSGFLGYKLIVSGTGDGRWGFTLLRKRKAKGDEDSAFVIEWLSDDLSARTVPEFMARDVRPVWTLSENEWKGQAHYKVKNGGGSGPIRGRLERGTAVKVYSYMGLKGGRGFTAKPVDRCMRNLPFPVCCAELDASADPEKLKKSDGADIRFAWGGFRKLYNSAMDCKAPGIPDAGDLPRAHEFEIPVKHPENGSVKLVKASALFVPAAPVSKDEDEKEDMDKPSSSGVERFSPNRIFYSYHGQIHTTGRAHLDSAQFLKGLGLRHCRNEVAIFLDVSGMGREFFENVFMPSRDRVSDGVWLNNLTDAVRAAVSAARDHGLLGQWEKACKDRDVAKLLAGALDEEKESGFSQLREMARYANSFAKKEQANGMLVCKAQNLAVQAAQGEAHARGAEEGQAKVSSLEIGERLSEMDAGKIARESAALGFGNGKKKARGEKTEKAARASDAPARPRSAQHGILVPGAAAGGEVPAAKVSAAKLVRADGSEVELDPESHEVTGQWRQGSADAVYSIGFKSKKQEDVEADLGEGACVIVRLDIEGQLQPVHAKLVWVKDKRASAPRRAESGDVKVVMKLVSKDGREIGGKPTMARGDAGIAQGQCCRVDYAGSDKSVHNVVCSVDVDDPMLSMVWGGDGAAGGDFLAKLRESVGAKVFIGIEQTGLSEESLTAFLEWQEKAPAGCGLWHLDARQIACQALKAAPESAARKKLGM